MAAEALSIARLCNDIWYGNHPARWVLWPIAILYRGLAGLRRALYRHGVLRTVTLPVPVIVVGNVSVGGTGKTPFIIWLAAQLKRLGFRPGIVTRGYRGRADVWPQAVTPESDPAVVGDEPVLLARRTGCPLVAGPDRVAAAERLLELERVDTILSDDGLQHYRLGRRIEIAVVDGVRGMGNGLCLPAGPLREPPARLADVDAVVVNGGSWGAAGVFRAAAVVTRVYRLTDGVERSLAEFVGAPVHAVAGIGNPQRFFGLLEDAGLEVIPHPLDDHADLTAEDLRYESGVSVLITEKDAVKCRDLAHPDLWCVVVDLDLCVDDGERLLGIVTRNLQRSAV
jgi:tetraacyldisaccharide 4'-kinase